MESKQEVISKRTQYYLPKLLFFMSGVSGSFWGRFDTLWFNDHGLTSWEIGVINGMIPLISFFASILWGMLVDKFGRRRIVMFSTLVMRTVLLQCLNYFSFLQSFALVATLMAMWALLKSAGSILNALVLDMLTTDKAMYGQQRLWLAVSWGIFSVFAGLVLDGQGWTGVMTSLAIMNLLLGALVLSIPKSLDAPKGSKRFTKDHSIFREALELLRGRRRILFYTIVFTSGMGLCLVENFLFLYIVTDLKGTELLCGITVGITVIFEIPLFYWSKQLLNKWGIVGMITVSHLAYISRVVLYTYLTPETVWWVLAIEPLHGVTFACVWSAAVHFSAITCPEGLEATAQGLLGGTYGGIGFAAGSIGGGFVLSNYGAVVMFRGAAVMMTIIMCVHIFCTYLWGHPEDMMKPEHPHLEEQLLKEILPSSDAEPDDDGSRVADPERSEERVDVGSNHSNGDASSGSTSERGAEDESQRPTVPPPHLLPTIVPTTRSVGSIGSIN